MDRFAAGDPSPVRVQPSEGAGPSLRSSTPSPPMVHLRPGGEGAAVASEAPPSRRVVANPRGPGESPPSSDESTHRTAAMPRPGPGPAPGTPLKEINLDDLADKVQRKILRQLADERLRKGLLR